MVADAKSTLSNGEDAFVTIEPHRPPPKALSWYSTKDRSFTWDAKTTSADNSKATKVSDDAVAALEAPAKVLKTLEGSSATANLE